MKLFNPHFIVCKDDLILRICFQFSGVPLTKVVKNESRSGILRMDEKILSNDAMKKSIDDNTNGVLRLIDEFDPLISWEKLSKKILSKYSLFEDTLQRACLKSIENGQNSQNIDPIQVFQILLVQIDELLESIKIMLEDCCNILPFENEASHQNLSLLSTSQSQCKYFSLIRSVCFQLTLRSLWRFRLGAFNGRGGGTVCA